MADSERTQKSRKDVESVLTEFDKNEDMLEAFCSKTKSLIEASLQDANIRYQSVQFRVKSKKKLREKYLDPTKDYGKLDDITDLAGLRVVTYYEDDIDRVAEVIKGEFDLDPENSVDRRDTEPDRFGYSAVNYVCAHQKKRTSDVEYKKFAGVRCEIQITSILMHAWSEIEHEWYDLRDAYPDKVKRRFYRIAALLELAESEFLSLRKIRSDYQRSVAVQIEAKVPDLPIDAVSVRSFIEQEPLVSDVDRSIAAALGRSVVVDLPEARAETRSQVAIMAGMTTLQDIRDALSKHRNAIPEFARQCRQEFWPERPFSRHLFKGISIYQLSRLVVSLQGAEAIAEFLKKSGDKRKIDITRQAAIAQEVFVKYSR